MTDDQTDSCPPAEGSDTGPSRPDEQGGPARAGVSASALADARDVLGRIGATFGRLVTFSLVLIAVMVASGVVLSIVGVVWPRSAAACASAVQWILTGGFIVILLAMSLFLVIGLVLLRRPLQADDQFSKHRGLSAPDRFTLGIFCLAGLTVFATPTTWFGLLVALAVTALAYSTFYVTLDNLYAYARLVALTGPPGRGLTLLTDIAKPTSLLAILVAQDPVADAFQIDGHWWSGFARSGVMLLSLGILSVLSRCDSSRHSWSSA